MIRAISVPSPYGPIFIEPALPRSKYDAMIFPFSHGFKRGGEYRCREPSEILSSMVCISVPPRKDKNVRINCGYPLLG